MAVFDFSTSGQDTQGQLKHFSAQFCWHFGSALLRALSYKKDPGRLCMLSSLLWTLHLLGRVDCRRLRQRQCDRTPPLSLRTFCAAPLLSCQRLGTSRTLERMDAAIWPSACKYPPNAGPDVRPSVFSCYGVPLRAWDGYPLLRGRPVHRPPGQTCFQDKAQVGTPWTQVQKSRPTLSVPPRCLPWYGSTTHLGTVVKRPRLLCYGCRATATALPVVFVTVLLPTGSGSARSDGLCVLTTNHPYGPSLVVGSYLVWDATRRELWETALLSTTRRLPVREYWTQ